MSQYQNIRVRFEDRVGRITFARPPLNVLNIAMMREVVNALTQCINHPEMVAVVFDQAPETRAFSAGMAIEEHRPETIYQMLESFHSIFRVLRQLAKPTIALVDGAALGGGCGLAIGCDIVIASDRARFGQPEVKLGVIPSVAAVLLPGVIGERRARELLLTGELVDATEAARIGLVNYVVTSAQLEQKAQELLVRLRELSAAALEATRRTLDIARGCSFDEALTKVEDLYLNEVMKTEDAREGISAFLAKRKPVWRNR